MFQKMSFEEKQDWKNASKAGSKTPEFRILQRDHSRLVEARGPGLSVPIPHQTYFTQNEEAQNFMQKCPHFYNKRG